MAREDDRQGVGEDGGEWLHRRGFLRGARPGAAGLASVSFTPAGYRPRKLRKAGQMACILIWMAGGRADGDLTTTTDHANGRRAEADRHGRAGHPD